MKKIFMLSVITSLIAPAFADTVFSPDWKEFCPLQYANIDTQKDYKLTEKQYWANRKLTFEKRVEKCNALNPNQQEACYAKVRELENSANHTKNEFRSVQLQKKCKKPAFTKNTVFISQLVNKKRGG